MKKIFALILAACFSLTLFSACGKTTTGESNEPSTTKPDNKLKATDNSGTPSDEGIDKALSQLGALTGMNEWPKDKLPAEMPEYTDGEVINHGDFGDGAYVVKVKDTNEEALEMYKKQLEQGGWDMSGSTTAKKAEYTIDYLLSEAELQVIVYTAKTSAWPSEDQLPAALFAPEGYTMIDLQLSPNSDDDTAWLLNYTCKGMDEAGMNAYIESLLAKGWVGDASQMTIETQWKGKPAGMTLELYEQDGGNTSFTCNYGIIE